MQAHINSIIAVFFLLIGAIAVGLMLELKGKPKDRLMNRQMILAHRILGYAFVVLYMIMLYIMIVKSSNYQEELSPRAILHVAMAVALMPLIVIKILIARRYKVMTGRLLGLGVGILITAFVLSSITAGHYLLHYEDISYTSITAVDSDILDEKTGRYFL